MKIIMATTGSGGHVFPALEVGRKLKDKGHDVLFVGAGGFVLEKIKTEGFDLFLLPSQGFLTSSLRACILSVAFMIMAMSRAYSFLRKARPDVVVGFGGYGAFPVILAAFFQRIPSLIHEQNVIPGRANKILSVFTDKIACSFSESQEYFPSRKVVLTGCPCRIRPQEYSKKQGYACFHFDPSKKTILVLGGSRGSRHINEECLKAFDLLKEDLSFQVIHSVGREGYSFLKEAYEKTGISHCVFDFLDEMGYAYKVADLVIARAGAMTVFEIASFRVPAILVPYPFAGSHQRENARVLVKTGLARIIEDQDLSAQRLKDVITDCWKNRQLQQNQSLEITGTCEHLVREILSLENES